MLSAGPNLTTRGRDDASIGNNAWLNPGNITTENGINATGAVAGANNTHYLKADAFGFAIPTGSVIAGIVAEWKRKATTSASAIKDNSVKLLQGGVVGGSDKADPVTTYPLALTWKTYGNSTDLWGRTWVVNDINTSGFGCVLSAKPSNGTFSDTAAVDACRITVYYNDPAAVPRIVQNQSAHVAIHPSILE